MTTAINTLGTLRPLESLYRHGYRSEVVDGALEKIVSLERAQALQELSTIEASLKTFEDAYKMSSCDFHRRFHAGELGDEADFFEWSALYGMAESLRQRLQTLGDPA